MAALMGFWKLCLVDVSVYWKRVITPILVLLVVGSMK
jgi:hypothetical protein